jgi:hypothetical protein
MKPAEERLRRRRQHSAPAALKLVAATEPTPLIHPSLTVAVEPFAAIARELPRLFEMNWQEMEQDGFGLPLNPDWDLMFDLAQTGRLHVVTARCAGTLVGYIFNIVVPHIYTKADLQGQVHLFFLHPDYRDEPGFLIRWFRHNDVFLADLGCKKILAMTPLSYRDGKVGLIFKRLGYTPIETIWARMP